MPSLRLLSKGDGIGNELPDVIQIDRPVMAIGRSGKCDVQLNSNNAINTISRRHAEILSGPEGVTIRDAGSVNGVFVNRVKIDAAVLKHGDEVQFGGAAGLPVGAALSPDTPTSSIVYRFEGDQPEPRKRPSSASSKATSVASVPSTATGKRKSRDGGEKEEDTPVTVGSKKKPAVAQQREPEADVSSPPLWSVVRQGQAAAQQEERRESEMEAIRKVLEVAPNIDVLPTVQRLVEVKKQTGELNKACQGLMAQVKKLEGEKDRLQNKVKEAQGQQREQKEAAEEQLKKVQAEKSSKDQEVQELKALLREKDKGFEQQLAALQGQLEESKAKAQAQMQEKDEEMTEMQSQLSDAKANEAQASKLLDDVEKKVAELQATNKKLEQQASEQRKAQIKLKKELKALGSLEREEPAASGAAELVRSLRGELGCAICSDLILDAGILPCSHGFCYKCIHGKLGEKRQCPLCGESGRPLPGHVRPRRSTHLDTVVHMLSEQSFTPAEKEKWEVRLEEQAKFWRSMGGEEVGYQAEEAGEEGNENGKKKKSKSHKAKPVCEGCNEEGHTHAECPHADDRYEDEGEESGDEEDDDEEEERIRLHL